MAAHTLGPWCIDPEYDHEQVTGPDGITVADCLIVAPRGGPSLERIRANARLIAAAPALLKALEASNKALIAERDCLYDNITISAGEITDPADGEDLAEYNAMIDANRAAIAKATGDGA